MNQARTDTEVLGPDEAHVWYAWVEACRIQGRLEGYYTLLNADERSRFERLASARLRDEFLVTRALCRTTLSRYVGIDAREWRFESNRFGRPEIAGGAPPFRFNLSNARSVVACVVTCSADAGVDVEELSRGSDLLAIADHQFAACERAALSALPMSERRRRAVSLWTLKEAYLKARGVGLSISLDEFAFMLDGSPPRVRFRAAGDDVAASWQFELNALSSTHIMALAIRHDGRGGIRVRHRTTIPSVERKESSQSEATSAAPGRLLAFDFF
ncbi:4'-phosphopantetheinyl transferase superfamily protein [Xanthomonas campestris pv. fici]|uniref:4'-phosphopantetheinyl transferase family protein n=1 Tax=Xanthomonas euvesicatoria TaxID=456327 RepID=UPI003556858E